jgi:hypothetical protein
MAVLVVTNPNVAVEFITLTKAKLLVEVDHTSLVFGDLVSLDKYLQVRKGDAGTHKAVFLKYVKEV